MNINTSRIQQILIWGIILPYFLLSTLYTVVVHFDKSLRVDFVDSHREIIQLAVTVCGCFCLVLRSAILKKNKPSWLPIAYFFGAGTVLALAGCYLFVTHFSVDVGRTLMAIGMLLELTAFFLIAKRLIKQRRIA